MIRSMCVLALSMFLCMAGGCAANASSKPNIIVILCDDMGYSDIGCYGGEIQTPNLDKLAAGGVRFTEFYNTARCCPTRASILTGLYPHQAGIGHMTDHTPTWNDGYTGELNSHCVTIAQALKPAGYGTYQVGKWHVTKGVKPDGPKENWPLQRGFDHCYSTIIGAGSFYDPGTLTRDNTMITPENDADYQPKSKYYYTDAIADNACKFASDHFKNHAAEPMFMYVAFTAAHWPMQCPEETVAKYKGKYDQGYDPIRKARFERLKELGMIDPKWDLSPQWGDWSKVKDKAWEARCMEVYAAMIDRMDQGVGRIVDTLKKNGQFDNTLILWLQDNGGCAENIGRGVPKGAGAPGVGTVTTQPTHPMTKDELQLAVTPSQTRDGRPMRQGPGIMPGAEDTYISYGQAWANVSNTPFREYKHWVHEGGISTPLIAHWPAKITRHGELEPQPGHLIDVMATCVDAGGATYPKEMKGQPITPMEGRSLLPAFAAKPIDREAIYWEHEGNRAVRMGKWKLVAKNPGGKWELYDIDADRTEMHDLAAAQPDRVASMTAKWEAYAKRANVLPWPWKQEYGKVEDDPKPATY